MPANQVNVEYWYRLFYECITGACYGSPGLTGVAEWLTQLWIWITLIGYVFSIIGLFVVVYVIVRLFELRAREAKLYSSVLLTPEAAGGVNPRWRHIESLIGGASPSEWREAIVEADIMLDDLLSQKGYVGEGVGEKLKSITSADLGTLNDAWEAHKVRNQIAHEGSAFKLSETLAHRTVARYAAVFREFRAI